MTRVQEPGQRLRSTRERLKLRYRDVQTASHRLADRKGNANFVIGLSRLADIENKGTVPSIYRLYSLCAIYGLDYATVAGWYGIDLPNLPLDSANLPLPQTRLLQFESCGRIYPEIPLELEQSVDLRRTCYLSRHVEQWGKFPIALLNGLDLRHHRYGFIGTEDWSMYPILAPGSFIQVDDTKRRVNERGWFLEFERPIYLIEHRGGYRCGWLVERSGILILQTPPASRTPPEIFRYPRDADIVGQVVAVAMRLDLVRPRHKGF